MFMKKIAMLTAAVMAASMMYCVPCASAQSNEEPDSYVIAKKEINAYADWINSTDRDFLEACSRDIGGQEIQSEELDGLDMGPKTMLYYMMSINVKNIWQSDEDLESDCIYSQDITRDTKKLDPDDALEVFNSFINDNPQYFFLIQDVCIEDNIFKVYIRPEYKSAAVRNEAKEQMKAYVISTAEELRKLDTAYEKAEALHDKIVDNTELIDPDSTYAAEHDVSSVMSVIRDGKAAPDAYARTYRLVLNYMHIENYPVVGKLSDGKRQQWAIVRMDNDKYYYVDCAADDAEGSKKYLFAGSETIADRTLNAPEKKGEDHGFFLPPADTADYDRSVITWTIPDDFDKDEFIKRSGKHYAYDFLGEQENGESMQKLYDAIYKAALEWWDREDDSLDPWVDLSLADCGVTSSSEASAVLICFLGDNPQFFYVSDKGRYGSDYLRVYISEDYIYSDYRNNAKAGMINYVMNEAEELKKLDTDYEKVLAFHDKLVDECEFDTDNMDRQRNHNVIGPMVDGKTVCEGYAHAFDMMMTYVGVDSVYVRSPGHAWNMVKLDDGIWYYMDVTGDDSSGSKMYFCVGEESFAIGAGIYHTTYSSDINQLTFFYPIPEGSKTVDFDADAFMEKNVLNKCASRYGYDFLGTTENGKAKQEFYNYLNSLALTWWNADADAELRTQKYYMNEVKLRSTQEGLEVYRTFLYDNPQFFYMSRNCTVDSESITVSMVEEYKDAAAFSEAKKAMINYVIKTGSELNKLDTIYAKVSALQDKLISEVDYDFDAETFKSSTTDSAQNVIGAITKGKAAPEGYAMTFHLIMDYIGVDNMYACNITDEETSAWNIVKVDDGKYYVVDCLSDDLSCNNDYLLTGSKKQGPYVHIPNTPDDKGERFLYALPELSEEDYSPIKWSDKVVIEPYFKGFALGDINGDEGIDIEDAVMIINDVNGVKPLSDDESKRADIDKNDTVDIEDAVKVIAYVNGVSTF